MRVQIGTAPRRRSLLWFLKRNFSYLVQKSRPKDSDLLKPPFYKGLDEVSPKPPRLSDGGSFRVRQEFFSASTGLFYRAWHHSVDALNARYGKGKVFSAAHGLGARSWHMKRQKLSARPTTMRVELMTVR